MQAEYRLVLESTLSILRGENETFNNCYITVQINAIEITLDIDFAYIVYTYNIVLQ